MKISDFKNWDKPDSRMYTALNETISNSIKKSSFIENEFYFNKKGVLHDFVNSCHNCLYHVYPLEDDPEKNLNRITFNKIYSNSKFYLGTYEEAKSVNFESIKDIVYCYVVNDINEYKKHILQGIGENVKLYFELGKHPKCVQVWVQPPEDFVYDFDSGDIDFEITPDLNTYLFYRNVFTLYADGYNFNPTKIESQYPSKEEFSDSSRWSKV